MEGFDPLFPADLANAHPLACDQDTKFQEEGHRYAVRIDNSWTTEGLISVTGWIKQYTPKDNDDMFKFSAMRRAKEINAQFMASLAPIDPFEKEMYEEEAEAVETTDDESAKYVPKAKVVVKKNGVYPSELYDMVDERDWVGAVKCYQKTSTVAQEFGDQITHTHGFVRMPYTKMSDDALKDSFEKWKSSSKTIDEFGAIFGPHEIRVLAVPPYLTGNDIQGSLWTRYGTRLHRDIEYHLNGHPPIYTQNFVEWRQFQRFLVWMEAQGHTPFRTELTMSVPGLRLCGQADFVAKKADGTYVLYDWKRTASMKHDGNDPYSDRAVPMLGAWSHRKNTSRDKYTIQANLYKQMIQNYGMKVTEIYLVCFHKTLPDFLLIPIEIFRAGSNTPDGRALRQMVVDRKKVIANT